MFPWEGLKRPPRVISLQSTVALPMDASSSHNRGSHWSTSHSAPLKSEDAENHTCSDAFKLDLCLINIWFAWSIKKMSSERWGFPYTSAGRCIFTSQFSFGGAVLKRGYKRYSPTATYSFIFFLWKRCRNSLKCWLWSKLIFCWWSDSGTPFQCRTEPDYGAIFFFL